ncbi:hypothetical protein JFR03_004073 [Aeromonas veronii]|nr:hypothetical protein [Aeromonas veronii]
MRTRFKLLVHESNGQQFENLFVKIMSYAIRGFKPVKAHGNIGDRGNDGWCSESGVYYQVYAPENLPKNNEDAIKKMEGDFEKLINYWDQISKVNEYYFVINDKYQGISPHLSLMIKQLKDKHRLRNAGVILSQDLENMCFSLSVDIQQTLIGSQSPAPQKTIHQYLIDEITSKMYLKYWPSISENLISNAIESLVIDGFFEAIMLVFKTNLPHTNTELEDSITSLVKHTEILVDHFTKSPYATLSEDNKWWRIDMSWKRTWFDDQDEYHRTYELYENWRRQLYYIHSNVVFSLNLFSDQVRKHVYPQYFMGQSFTIVDSLGTYNLMQGYEAIPTSLRTV